MSSPTAGAAAEAHPSLLVFQTLLGVVTDLSKQGVRTASTKSPTPEVKELVTRVFEEAGSAITKLSADLDAIHVNVLDTPLKPENESAIKAALADAAQYTEIEPKSTALLNDIKKVKSQTTSIQSNIRVFKKKAQDAAKIQSDWEALEAQCEEKRKEIAELNEELKALSKESKANDEERTELQTILQGLKADHETYKKAKNLVGDLKKRVEDKRAKKAELLEKLDNFRMYEPAPASPEGTAMPLEETIAEVNADSKPCANCKASFLLGDLIIMFPCMHFLCPSCLMKELARGKGNPRYSFGFHKCPECFEAVETLDGPAFSGNVLTKSNGTYELEYKSSSVWKTMLCPDFIRTGSCWLSRADCLYAHGADDLRKS